MYPVSEVFLQAVQENTRRYYWTGKITTTKGVIYEFGPKDIVKGRVGFCPIRRRPYHNGWKQAGGRTGNEERHPVY